MNIGERMKERRKSLGLSAEQVAEKLEVSRASIYRYEKGEIEKFPIESLIPLAEVLQTTPADLMGWKQESISYIYNQLTPPRQQKVYHFAEHQLSEQKKLVNMEDYISETLRGYVSAGTGEYQAEEINEEVHLPKDIVPEQQYDMVLKVNGDSMEPMFQDGEYIFVRKDEHFRSGQIGVFIIDGESYLKKAYIEDSHIRLVSLNKDYKDLIFTDDSRIELIGTVVM